MKTGSEHQVFTAMCSSVHLFTIQLFVYNFFSILAPHLPKPVAIPFPEQVEAVQAQLRFAQAEDAAKKLLL